MEKKHNITITQSLVIGLAVGVTFFMCKKENRKNVKNAAEKVKSKMMEISEDVKIKEKIQTVKDKGLKLVDFNMAKIKMEGFKKFKLPGVEKINETNEAVNTKKVNSEKLQE
ncbi:hypothetical protein ABEY61_16550 [Bacillus toyonensis]|uniref:hypothetical protein n=1 Tax=Bacillus toyonensis TaxID=155322 RepID=UPI003D250FA9